MKYNIFNYKSMRAKKYYDVLRTNKSFMKSSIPQRVKILKNVLIFLKSTSNKKPLIVKNKPVTAQIEPTSECNLRCRMCIRDKVGVPIGRMSLENFKKILDKLDSLFKIGLSGQGELFLHPEIFDMIKYANSRGILVNITSNGTLLTDEIINKICESDIGEIGISVDSTYKEKYEKIRIGSNFEKLVSNIKKLTNEIKRRENGTIVIMTPIIFKDNIEELPKFVELAKEVGIKKIAFQTLQTKKNYLEGYGKDMKSQIVQNQIKMLTEKMKEAKELAEKYKITLIFDEEESPGCIWPWRGIYVTWNGAVTPCCKILDYNHPYFGNLLQEDFWKIWNGKEYQNFRSLLRERKTPEVCQGCNRV